jgi:hypothetical protein
LSALKRKDLKDIETGQSHRPGAPVPWKGKSGPRPAIHSEEAFSEIGELKGFGLAFKHGLSLRVKPLVESHATEDLLTTFILTGKGSAGIQGISEAHRITRC